MWLELSAVTIAANVEASILNVKKYDFDAASGKAITRQPWHDVDGEIREVKARIKKLDAEYADAEYKLDDARWNATWKALGIARSNLQKLETKRAEIMAGVYVEPVAAVAPSPVREHAKWEIDEAILKGGAPEYPQAARPGDRDVWNEGQDRFREFWIQASHDALRKAGTNPDDRVNLELVATLRGIEEARWLWLSQRCKALEERLFQVENNGIKAGGTYQRALSYSRGTVVSFGGSAWVALKAADAGIAPTDDHAVWQLLVKRGADGKDRT
ncbi:hypothetical protein ACFX5Q_07415 [Mesorhizobium sp. IMUNJ 23033]|uniref:hypothetical protein n=1 Tax=Mesorhizobium sp. IMUNJ 23033 TaxID=3378039 RepID=UPI003850CC4C